MKLMRVSYKLMKPFTRTEGPKCGRMSVDHDLSALSVHRMVSHPPRNVFVSMNQAQRYLVPY